VYDAKHCQPVQRRSNLLASLPADSLEAVLPHLEPVECEQRRVLVTTGQVMPHAYFPASGWVSLVRRLEDGRAAEVGLVGREGMVGLPIVLGSDKSYDDVIIQAPGLMHRISGAVLHDLMEEDPALQQHLLRYALTFQNLTSQTAACNGNHDLEQRTARWLLMAHDRADGDEFPMTQEFLAVMLSVHRPGVNITARLFHEAGLIRYGNGRLRITDRAGLEASACECYAASREQFDQSLRPPS